jgi:hypothetical protein
MGMNTMQLFDPKSDEVARKRISDWTQLRASIAGLPFVHAVEFGNLANDEKWPTIQLEIEVSLPSGGPVFAVRNREMIWLLLPDRFPSEHPHVVVGRFDFPATPHASRYHNGKWVELCLTRQAPDDWWVGRTLRDVVCRVKDWLDDAAAGLLVKPDDPHEPLFVPWANATVEVDGDFLQQITAEHAGLSVTSATSIRIHGRETSRFFVGQGPIPTVALFQPKAQPNPWIDCPTTLEEVKLFVDSIGLDAQRFEYWANKRKAGENQILILLGTCRTREVLGRDNAQEWVAFELNRPKAALGQQVSDWRVTAHQVRELFTPCLAIRLGGWSGQHGRKTIAFIGAGALGSVVCEAMARSGLVDLNIVDEDVLAPHNLARHTLCQKDVGQFKAQTLAQRLNEVYCGVEVAQGVSKSVQDLDSAEVQQVILGADFIVDCSASIAVQRWLADLPSTRPPVVSVFQVCAGRGTLILAESVSTDVRVTIDAIESVVLANRRDHPIVDEWLSEQVEPVQVGGGCRSASARVPDTLCKLGGAWAADAILNWIDQGNWPTESGFGIQSVSRGIVPSVRTNWIDVRMTSLSDGDQWKIWIRQSVVEDVKRQAGPNETGGILVGEIDRQRRVAYIVDSWAAPPDSESSPVGFVRGRCGLVPKLTLLATETRGRLGYVGEWHTHPRSAPATVSATDWATIRRMADLLSADRLPALCLITNGRDLVSCIVQR